MVFCIPVKVKPGKATPGTQSGPEDGILSFGGLGKVVFLQPGVSTSTSIDETSHRSLICVPGQDLLDVPWPAFLRLASEPKFLPRRHIAQVWKRNACTLFAQAIASLCLVLATLLVANQVPKKKGILCHHPTSVYRPDWEGHLMIFIPLHARHVERWATAVRSTGQCFALSGHAMVAAVGKATLFDQVRFFVSS